MHAHDARSNANEQALAQALIDELATFFEVDEEHVLDPSLLFYARR